MGLFTSLSISTVRKTHAGSSYFGPCDVCTLPASETFVGASFPVYKVDAKNTYYLGGSFGGGTYGHERCVRSGYPNAIDHAAIQLVDGRKVLPFSDMRDLLKVAMTVGTFHPYRRDMKDAEVSA